MKEKLKAMLISRRFIVAAVGVAVIAAEDLAGIKLDPTQTVALASIVIAWILGDTIRETK